MNRESISWLIINQLSLDRPTVFRSRWCAVIREPGSDLGTPAREYIHCDGFMWRPSQNFVDSIFNVRHKTKWGRFDGNTMTWAKHGDLGIGMWRKQQVGKEAYNYVQACPWSRASDTGQASWILHVLFISCVLMLYAALRGLVLCFFKISKWLLKIKPSKRSKTETMRLKDAEIAAVKLPRCLGGGGWKERNKAGCRDSPCWGFSFFLSFFLSGCRRLRLNLIRVTGLFGWCTPD